MGRGCSSQRVCSTLLFSLLPAITALFSFSPPAQPAAHIQAPGIFLFYPATPLPVFYCPIICLPRFLSPSSLSFIMVFLLQTCLSSSVATPHSARRHFGSMDITGETFLELRGTPGLPADHRLSPAFFISVCLSPVALFLSPLCSRTAGSDRVLNCLSVAFCTEQVSLWRQARGRTGLLGYYLTSEG